MSGIKDLAATLNDLAQFKDRDGRPGQVEELEEAAQDALRRSISELGGSTGGGHGIH